MWNKSVSFLSSGDIINENGAKNKTSIVSTDTELTTDNVS